MATMKDVAIKAGVSIATVSAVLSGAAFVSQPLKARVEQAITELGYARNAMARSLKRGNSSLIGLIVPDITNPFFTTFVDHAQRAAHAAGYTVLLGISGNDPIRERDALDLMRSHQAAGIILCPTGKTDGYANIGKSVGTTKIVLVDNASDITDVDSVVMDNQLAAELAARHLLRLGHQQIAVISGPEFQFVSQVRQSAFVKMLADKSIQLDSELVSRGNFREQEAYQAARQILLRNKKPTAIFVANNLMLIGVMRAIAELALRVPEDISVVSIDDFAWAAAFHPALTVVKQPIEEMATVAFQRLLARIANDLTPPQRHQALPELIVRQSSSKVAT